MSTIGRDAPGTKPARSLKDELASLKIERAAPATRPAKPAPADLGSGETPWSVKVPKKQSKPRGSLGLTLLSFALWAIPLSILGGVGYFAYDQYTRYKPATEVRITTVQSMTLGESQKLLSAKGYLKSRYQAQIGSKMPGRVEQMLVEEGSKVNKGDLIAVLEHADLKQMLAMRKATLERTQAELKELDTDIEDLDRKYKRQMRLLSNNAATTQEAAENAYYALKKAQAKRDQLYASIAMQNASIGEIEESIENMKIYAPFSGTITVKGAEVGETLTPGGMGAASGRGSVVTLADLQHLEVETDVPEGMLSIITPGQPAEVSVSAVPGKRYNGRLRTIIPMGDRAKGTVKVQVEILDPDEHLFPDLVGTVNFLPNKESEQNATQEFLFVERTAIQEIGGKSYAWVVKTDNSGKTLERREVEVLSSGDARARVERGLSAGEEVVLNPTENLKPGERVKITD